MALTGNKAVVYKGKGTVAVEDIGYPELILRDGPGVPKANVNRKCEHGVILKVITTNICGSDQHMVRGRTTAPEGLVLGHEITGEVIETGRDVEFIKKGDIVSVPFNIACGRCVMCKTQKTHVCLNVNPDRPGSAYGYVDMGGWVGGQSETGSLKIRFGLGWAKAHTFVTGQTPAMTYNRNLMKAILSGRAQIAKAVKATVISLDDAPKGYSDFDKGAAKKFVIDPHGTLK
ncbi:alcohol dehydrogenase catalytic domain-containing protein [Bacillus stercoris]|uniref:alcohol dehydrogenase catalytic domain-containing protein n=1 Tax=Bacillus stercoris TaxID=2054641 RepID=UPI001D06F113|nr:alcohol dehydrogenase catalytic domain-containing protein [Bacillus stercoris]MCB7154309.1 alcohol dehydrogenase catalytic domain-containing protein [Bacillus stercoris]